MGRVSHRSTLAGSVLILLPAFAFGAAHSPPELQRIFHPLAKIQQAAVYDQGSQWLIRGRITRTDNERWVPHGKVVASFNGQQFSGYYRPRHIEPKSRRASYFTIQIPKQALAASDRIIRLQYQPSGVW